MTTYAAARPRKRFFIDMFTRDISFEACILDLIDNAVDSLARTRKIDIAAEALQEKPVASVTRRLPWVRVLISENQIVVTDKCGGIPRSAAENEVFNFGYGPEERSVGPRLQRQLGAYGIGLKRAVFKLGRELEMRSQTEEDGFEVSLDLEEWASRDSSFEDWRIPIDDYPPARSRREAGTSIKVRRLREEIKERVGSPGFTKELHTSIAGAYTWFLNRHLTVTLNRAVVEPLEIPIGGSGEIEVAQEEFTAGAVTVKIFASLARRVGRREEWRAESAGWYVMCNGRTVVLADKSELTGWGGGALPSFQPKYRGFVGLVFFESGDPLALPWTTTKRGLHLESPVYLKARNRMRAVARPILTFLDDMYPSDTSDSRREREVAQSVTPLDIRKLHSSRRATFEVGKNLSKKRSTTVRVQFDADKKHLDAIRQHLRKPDLAANRIGRHVLDYYLDAEGLR